MTIIVVENGGFQSIRNLQMGKTSGMFATEFRYRSEEHGRLDGAPLEIDYAANAKSLGCEVFEARTLEEFSASLSEARVATRPTVIVVHVEPQRLMLDSGCWWDVGISEISSDEKMSAIGAKHLHERFESQRHYL